MKLCMRLALCAWLTACGSGPAPPGTPPEPSSPSVPVRLPAVTPFPVASPCARPHYEGYEHSLLQMGCGELLEPGRATWTVSGDTVVLRFPTGKPGPRGPELVSNWPPRNRPPWLGHMVNRVVILADGGIRVEFRNAAPDIARLFADPRLAGVPLPAVEEGDVRDAIDANAGRIVTRHDASIEYARSLGRSVDLVAYDRLYLVAFAGRADDAAAEALRDEVGIGWIGMGATLARRLPSLRWATVAGTYGPGAASAPGETVAAPGTTGSGAPPPPTVSYPEDDPAARQIAERMVSLGLPGGRLAATIAELTGSGERMVVRPVPAGGDGWERTDVAAVYAVYAGPVHPRSLYAEVFDRLRGWEVGDGRGIPTVLLIGEAASFGIEPAPARLP